MNSLQHRISAMIGRCVIAAVNDDSKFQELQVELFADEVHDGVEHFQPYGFTARAQAGAEGLMLAIGGLRGNGVVIGVGDRRYRMTGLAEGEVAIHDDQGQSVLLGRNGIVITGKKLNFASDGDIVFNADAKFRIACTDFDIAASGHAVITATGHAEIEGSSIDIGHAATLKAARDTDPINDSTDRIAGGSNKVKVA